MPPPPPPPPSSGSSGDGKGSSSNGSKTPKDLKDGGDDVVSQPQDGVSAKASSATSPTLGTTSEAASTSSQASSSHPSTDAQTEDVPVAPSQSKEIKPVSSIASQYLDMTEIPASAEEQQQQGRTGARSTSGKRPMSSIERKRRNLGRAMLASFAVGTGIFAWQLGREWDNDKEKERLGRTVTDEQGLNGRWQRGQARFWDMLDVSSFVLSGVPLFLLFLPRPVLVTQNPHSQQMCRPAATGIDWACEERVIR